MRSLPVKSIISVRGARAISMVLILQPFRKHFSRVNFLVIKKCFYESRKIQISCFEIADIGTLFLDEIDTMQLDRQVILLRVLEERKIIRLNSRTELPVDVSIISAINNDLNDLIKKK